MSKHEMLERLGSERTRTPRKKLDRLPRDSMAAEAAGMSYGNYKALHPHTPEEDKPAPPKENKPPRICRNCGKEIPADAQKKKIYCDANCQYEYNHRKTKDRKKAKEEETHANA